MQIFSGQSISSDVVFGPLHFLTPAPPTISAHSPLPPEEEWERFSTAHRQAVLELAQLYDQAVQMVGEKLATIFAIHAMLLDDQDYQDTVYSMIFSCGCTAEHASKTAMDHLVSLFEQMDSPYMQARASDVRAISDRMLRILTGRGAVPPVSFSPSILVSTEFAPSQIITLDRSGILGFIAMRGSVQSHAAALSRALSIPALVKLDLSASLEGHTALLDGGAQKLYVDPTPDILSRLGPPDPSIRLSTPNQL